MKNINFTHTRLTDITVVMQSQKDNNLQVLRGKVLLSKKEKFLIFVQNNPQGARSIEKMRTAHSRLVLTPQGRCTLTFRFSPDEKELPQVLMAEMAEIIECYLLNLNIRKEN